MSEPWIRAYMADMRADPKLFRMSADLRLALLHAYDLAKNGPGEVADLRRSDGRAMRERELRELSSVSPSATRRMFERWASVGLCELVEEAGETLCTFPTLARRQGIDRTNALRQKRFRERHRNAPSNGDRNAEVTPQSNGPVTGENQSTDNVLSTDALGSLNGLSTQNVVDRSATTRVWAAFVEHHPKATWTTARKQLIQRRLGDFSDETLIAAIHGNHADPYCNGENASGKQYHGLELILRSADHIERYAAIHTGSVNGQPRRPIEDILADAEKAGF